MDQRAIACGIITRLSRRGPEALSGEVAHPIDLSVGIRDGDAARAAAARWTGIFDRHGER